MGDFIALVVWGIDQSFRVVETLKKVFWDDWKKENPYMGQELILELYKLKRKAFGVALDLGDGLCSLLFIDFINVNVFVKVIVPMVPLRNTGELAERLVSCILFIGVEYVVRIYY